ncbi:MAG TPA: hypothetical protein VKB19_17850, partial [Pedobacter sp.]|nr:hypothetical protein [Pedobacter sp.]
LTGNDQIGDYAYLDTYRSAYQYQGIGTLGPDRLYNPKYGWEVNKKLEGAVELGFLNDRILLTTAWYRNSSSNQLINYQLAGTTGYASVLQNSPATVQNTGLEMELTTTNISRRALTWSTSVNFTVPKNKLLSFPNIESSSYANTYIVGKPLNITKVYRYLGVNSSTGLYEVEDVNGDGQYTPEDKVSYYIQGENFYGGINNSFTFKGIQADILFQFVSQKGQLSYLEYGGGELSFNNGIGNRPASASQGRWEKSGDNAIKQYFSRADDAAAALNRFITSDALTGDSYYIRLKNVSLSYQLPNRLLKGIKGRFYLQGQNLLTFTDYKGLDPESGISSLPPLTTVVAGIQLTF